LAVWATRDFSVFFLYSLLSVLNLCVKERTGIPSRSFLCGPRHHAFFSVGVAPLRRRSVAWLCSELWWCVVLSQSARGGRSSCTRVWLLEILVVDFAGE
jgi:hypothetical protein